MQGDRSVYLFVALLYFFKVVTATDDEELARRIQKAEDENQEVATE